MVEQFEEKRGGERVDFETRIVLKTSTSALHLQGNSKDLALKGLFVTTREKIDIGTPCEIRIKIGGVREMELHLEGTIVRQTADGVGIAFNSMDLDTYTHLKNIVRYNSHRFDGST